MANELSNNQLSKIVRGFQEIIDRQQEEIEGLKLRMTLVENSTRRNFDEMANTKQLVAHVSGRGMGSTVHAGE